MDRGGGEDYQVTVVTRIPADEAETEIAVGETVTTQGEVLLIRRTRGRPNQY